MALSGHTEAIYYLSAFGGKADIPCRLALLACLFDHVVRAGEQHWRERDAERVRDIEV